MAAAMDCRDAGSKGRGMGADAEERPPAPSGARPGGVQTGLELQEFGITHNTESIRLGDQKHRRVLAT